MMLKNIICSLILLLGAYFIYDGFSQKARYSTIIGGDGSRNNFKCLYNAHTGQEDPANILIYGSSRTGAMFNDKMISRTVTEFSGKPTLVKSMNIAGGDIAMSYMFLKEYVAANPNPDTVYVEIMRIKQQVSLIPYVNRAFSSTADATLTTDMLRNFDDGRSAYMRGADFFKTVIDKNDKYLSKVLVRRHDVNVDNPEACTYFSQENVDKFVDRNFSETQESAMAKLQAAYAREVQKLDTLKLEAADIRREDNIKRRERAIHRHNKEVGPDWESQPAEDWGYDTKEAQRQIYYYRKLSKLARDNDIKLVFFRPYGLREPAHDPKMIAQYEAQFDSDIIAAPYDIAKLSYPYFYDPNHPGRQTQRVFAFWLAEDIMKRAEQ